MQNKTLEQLRAIARKQGRSGYSRLRKKELLRLLAQKMSNRTKPKPAAKRAKPKAAYRGSVRRGTKSRKRAAAGVRRSTSTVAAKRPRRTSPSTTSARKTASHAHVQTPKDRAGKLRGNTEKYAPIPPVVELPVPFVAADLDEDGDLPPLPDALIGLLPQKPGILHGYWALEPGTLQRQPDLRIRLCRIRDRVLEVLDEIPLPSDSGRWYFHVGDLASEAQLYTQLGYYHTDGTFITPIGRGIARLPSPQASTHTDTDWWISEAEFRKMYVRTGGRIDGPRLVWSASVSSR